ncbi:MAG: hypothetical protein KDH17_22225 [Rhodocyclaceae bacterium]|nr:hypothetical protein [Rhodocyclaceae bacterium]
MRFHEDGAVATPESLLASAMLLGLDPEKAVEQLAVMAATIMKTLRDRLRQADADQEDINKLESAFKVAHAVANHWFDPIEVPARQGWYRRA